MDDKLHFPNAPIKEAIISIRVALPEQISPDKLISRHSDFKKSYPTYQAIKNKEFSISADVDEFPGVTQNYDRIVGYQFISADKLHIAQFRFDSFIFSRLEPYNTWEEMQEEAKRLWEIYILSVEPNKITRVATKFVNIIKIPYKVQLGDYFTAPPSIPAGLNQSGGDFFTRVTISEPELGSFGIITMAVDGAEEGYAAVVLDIDVFKTKFYDEVSSEEYWSDLEQLRHFKNRIFTSSLTQKAMELFE